MAPRVLPWRGGEEPWALAAEMEGGRVACGRVRDEIKGISD